MTDPRAAGEVLAAARARGGAPAPRRGPTPSAPPAPRSASGSTAPRLGLAEGRAQAVDPLGLPLTDLHLQRIDELERLLGRRYLGWGREGAPSGPGTRGTYEAFFVDVLDSAEGVERHRGETLHLALGDALEAARGTR